MPGNLLVHPRLGRATTPEMAVPLTESAVQAPPWVLSARVTAPDLVRGYYDRPELLARIDPLEDRRITVLTAPGGFGKTTLLADLHRRARNRGRVAAWLTLTGDDTPAVLGAYLACAFERAGLPLSGGERPGAAAPAGYTALLAHAIEAWGAPCLLILDDAGRLVVRETVEALDALLRYGPRNLHVAVAGRRNPGLDVDEAVLAGRGLRVGVEQLRFSLSEIAGFVGPALSGSDLQALAARTEGWPVALQLYRNLQAGRTQPVSVRDFRGDKGVAANFLGERLLRTLSGADREFLLDLALFEWIEPALVDEVLEMHDARRRVAALAELDGLLHDRGDDVVRLHPLIRDYCAARRFRDTPDRFRRIHAAIARSSARRNRLVPAVRHARDAGDDRLVGDVVEEAGGLRLWCTEGMTRLLAIDRLLTPAVIETHPRVAFLHCIVLAMRGKLGAARALCDDVGRRTRGFTRDRAGGDDRALRAERVLVQGMLFGFGCWPIGDEAVLGVIAEMAALADDEELDPAIRGAYDVVLSAGNHQRARFEAGRQRVARAQAHFERCGSWYGALCCHFHAGIAAMAQGRVRSAAEHYASGRRIVRRHFPEDGGSALILDVLTAELDLERNRLAAEASPVPDAARLRDMGVWFDVYAAAFDVAVATTCDRRGAAAALAVLDETHEHVRLPGLASVLRYLSALRVSLLVAAGRVEQAEEAWRSAGLPDAAPALLDLRGQTWREMEAVACARVRLLSARGEVAAARELAAGTCEAAAARDLVRTLMWGLAAAMVVEHRAGAADRAAERLVEFLGWFRTTDYLRPLVRDRAVSLAVLRRLLATGGAGVRDAAEAVLRLLGEDVRAPAGPAAPALTPREVEVLEVLAGGVRDREIAARLGLTGNGVRYHLKRIYRKMSAAGRVDAVRRARALGVIS